jgi:hypothetical protein
LSRCACSSIQREKLKAASGIGGELSNWCRGLYRSPELRC